MRGDSFRRQTALAEAYALQNGLELDTSLTFHDLGVSAFRGRNAGPEGRLRAFVNALEQGLVPEGSYLLVESLDRISRQTARAALRLLETVVDNGAVVVTLADGRKYDKQALDGDPLALLLSILTFMRAHEESAIKASRLKAAWSAKRSQAIADKKPMTRLCPAWLELDKDTGTYRVIPHRVEIVQRIFSMALAGVGQHGIAHALNTEGIPTFRKAQHWHMSYVLKILNSPAVLGTYVPHVVDHSDGKKVRRPLDPIPDYFPKIISSETIERLQAMRLGGVQPRRGRHAAHPLSNLFGGLVRCSLCGGTMTLTNKGEGLKYLVCRRAKSGAGCTYRAVPYKRFESCFMLVWARIINMMPDTTPEFQRVEQSLQAIKDQLEWLESSIANIMRVIEGSDAAPTSMALLERLNELELERTNMQQQQREYLLRKQALGANMVSLRVETLRGCLAEEPIDKAKANAVLRQLFSGVQISPETEVAEFIWQHSEAKTPMHFGEKVPMSKKVITPYSYSKTVFQSPLPEIPKVPVPKAPKG